MGSRARRRTSITAGVWSVAQSVTDVCVVAELLRKAPYGVSTFYFAVCFNMKKVEVDFVFYKNDRKREGRRNSYLLFYTWLMESIEASHVWQIDMHRRSTVFIELMKYGSSMCWGGLSVRLLRGRQK